MGAAAGVGVNVLARHKESDVMTVSVTVYSNVG